jgi:hypothetical protein
MEAMKVTVSFRTLALTEEIEQPLSPPRFAKRPVEVIEKMISTTARNTR